MMLPVRLLRLRRLVQWAALALLAAVPWLNRAGFFDIRGNLFAFDFFGLPLADPLGPVQTALNGAPPGWRLAAGAGLALLLAACLGRVFCSWLCPFGLLSELTYGVCRRTGAERKRRRGGFGTRAVFVCLGLALAVAWGVPLLNQFSLPGALTLAFQNAALPVAEAGPGKEAWSAAEWAALFAVPFVPVLLVLAVEAVTGRRLWCRWLCPQSALLALAARLPWAVRLRRDMSRCVCKGTPACRSACSLELDPRHPRSASPLECTNCGACVRACAAVHGGKPGALSLGRPGKENGGAPPCAPARAV